MNIPRPYAIAVLVVLAVALVGGTVLTLRPGGDAGPPIAGRLGPTPGPDAEGHVAAKRAYLEALAQREPGAPSAALVSFSRLMGAGEASALLGDASVSAAFVRFPGADPEAIGVTGSLEGAVAARAEEVSEVTRGEIEALEAQGGDVELLERRRAEFAETTADCACVYAVAVERVAVRRLAELQGAEEVRLVDVPDPLTETLRGWELSPLFPGPQA